MHSKTRSRCDSIVKGVVVLQGEEVMTVREEVLDGFQSRIPGPQMGGEGEIS